MAFSAADILKTVTPLANLSQGEAGATGISSMMGTMVQDMTTQAVQSPAVSLKGFEL